MKCYGLGLDVWTDGPVSASYARLVLGSIARPSRLKRLSFLYADYTTASMHRDGHEPLLFYTGNILYKWYYSRGIYFHAFG